MTYVLEGGERFRSGRSTELLSSRQASSTRTARATRATSATAGCRSVSAHTPSPPHARCSRKPSGVSQWMTAGSGGEHPARVFQCFASSASVCACAVVHSEMPTDELLRNGGNMEGFQLWVNLPAKDKMVTACLSAARHGGLSLDVLPRFCPLSLFRPCRLLPATRTRRPSASPSSPRRTVRAPLARARLGRRSLASLSRRRVFLARKLDTCPSGASSH